MALQARVSKSYPKRGKDGVVRKMFLCTVTGTKEELEQYVALQSKRVPSAKWRDENGNVLYWTSSPGSAVINLDITINGNVVENTTAADLDASAKAKFDYTYNSVMKGLSGQGSTLRATPQAQPDQTPPVIAGGADPDKLED